MLDNKDEKINVNGIEIPDRADEFIKTGIKKGRRRGRIRLSQKLVAVVLVIFLGGGFFSETLAQQLDFIPGLGDIYTSFYKKRNLHNSRLENLNDNIIIEKKINDITMTIKNFAYDDNEAILFYEVKSNSEYFDIAYYSISDENGRMGNCGNCYGQDIQLSKNEKGEFVVNGIFNVKYFDGFVNTGTTNGKKMIFAFDLWSKTELDNLRDNDESNNRQIPNKVKPIEFDVYFELDKSQFEKGKSEIIDIFEKLEDKGLEFYIKRIEINPLSTMIIYQDANIEDGYIINSMKLTDGIKDFRQFGRPGRSSRFVERELRYESMIFEDVEELYITSYNVIREYPREEKLKIDFVNKTVNEEYKDFIEIIDVIYDEESGIWNVDLKWIDDNHMWIERDDTEELFSWVRDKEDFQKLRYFIYKEKDITEYEFTICEIKKIGTFECDLKIK